jgi:Polyketide cyclase / dehydrase and lipid transport
MKRILFAALCALFVFSNTAFAQSRVNSYDSVDFAVPADKVWNFMRDFDSLPKWHPAIASDMIISGENNVVGAIRQLTFKDGPTFDEELVRMDNAERVFAYRVIDPTVLPLEEYLSTFKVVSTGPKSSAVQWSSAYTNKSDSKMKDEEIIKFINGVYHAGLMNAKGILERKK